ncbi:MAG: gamma-glutamylcyclotransferase [Clostridia bacterium]|nr:gamma-glutamylcyclotransferase [Clostridia bacterium]
MKLFAYGTLKRRRRIEALVGRRLPPPEPGVLPGFRLYPTPRGYPIVLPDPDASVDGVVWEIREEDLPALDHYEGYDEDPPFYLRVPVRVRTAAGEVEAQVYVGNPDVYWDIEDETSGGKQDSGR